MSHSIHMLSIQIDSNSLELVIYHQFNNIKLSFFASHKNQNRVFHYVRLIDVVRLLDTLKYFTIFCLMSDAILAAIEKWFDPQGVWSLHSVSGSK